MTLLRETLPGLQDVLPCKTGTHLSRAQTSADQSMEQKQKLEHLPSDMAINSPAEKKQFAF
jgi:hypothetical protein